ncbi:MULTISPECIES: helix-turn-helix transcriptional regulator [Sporosarcina]|uniref:Transcriptional regulator, AraC family n=2 Tax=Sporosarcina newyorkensis TaxID=759851 RepID=A0A1T4XU81_9BACL|nr:MULTISPECIES: AraC family transcriptional regulator [Sporosarcina]EGQ21742.1 AraC family transcriptional regulator [Sporosarcina newyorkensis 2681]MBY0223110.1 helix-turn-helix transcriptional regulator [Sporosarcina aquimarina]SKA92611.1 transcriptional regulator, AraC family [Sporosarcina newyorkensis]
MSYSPVIQSTINFIEKNLNEELSLEDVSANAGFSKFHFHRIFQNETGVSVTEYVRYRRITESAQVLIYTNAKIIDIAMNYGFESQEAFSRAFKKYYHLPPGHYRKLMGNLTKQKEETTVNEEHAVKGWILSGSNPNLYQMGIDQETVHKGKSSGFLQSVLVQSTDEFATMMQQFKAEKYLGKRMKFSGFLKASSVEGFCGFWMRVDNTLGDVLQFDNMSNRQIKGDTEWNYYSIVLDVPENGSTISFGVLLSGKGQVWIDELRFEEVDHRVATTNLDITFELLNEPMNLSFEE